MGRSCDHESVSKDFFGAMLRIGRRFEPSLPDVSAASVQAEIDRYLSCGGDLSTADTIRNESGKAFLYLVHEAVELSQARTCLNAPAPASKVKGLTTVSGAAADPWKKAFSRCLNRGPNGELSPIQRADGLARAAESRMEQFLALLFFGTRTTLEGLAATISTGAANSATAQVQFADADARKRAADSLGLLRTATQDEEQNARDVRLKVWSIQAGHVLAFGSTAALAFGIWKARGEHHGGDVDDWVAAEEALSLV